MTKYLIETIASYRIRYVIEADTLEEAVKEMKGEREFRDLSQKYLGEEISFTKEVSDDEICEMFFEDTPYLIEHWKKDEPLKFVHKVEKIDCKEN